MKHKSPDKGVSKLRNVTSCYKPNNFSYFVCCRCDKQCRPPQRSSSTCCSGGVCLHFLFVVSQICSACTPNEEHNSILFCNSGCAGFPIQSIAMVMFREASLVFVFVLRRMHLPDQCLLAGLSAMSASGCTVPHRRTSG